jgi:hypothetical protein
MPPFWYSGLQKRPASARLNVALFEAIAMLISTAPYGSASSDSKRQCVVATM